MLYILRVLTILLLSLLPFCSCSTDKEKMIVENNAGVIFQGIKQVSDVEVSGDENAYTFSVTILSPDTGCDQYADWWEIIDLDGNLLYRRILDHSHVTEQPFTRQGENIELAESQEVYVRMHMNNSGYGAEVQKGSVGTGFQPTELDVEFAEELQNSEPLPEACSF